MLLRCWNYKSFTHNKYVVGNGINKLVLDYKHIKRILSKILKKSEMFGNVEIKLD